MNIEPDPHSFLQSANSGSWDAFLIDFDTLPANGTSPVDVVKQINLRKPFVVIGSFQFAKWHEECRQHGGLVLHKPTSAGEIGLALRKLKNG